jgi:Xaa-Pro aminopeptidase
MSNDTPLTRLRALLRAQQIDAFIIESGDKHQSEYVHESDARRAFISGFKGSAGTAVVLQDVAYLWTDGRYFLQAAQELSPEWTLMKSRNPGVLEMEDFLPTILSSGQVVAVDSFLMNTKNAEALTTKLGAKGVIFKGVLSNPVDEVWGADRPALPNGKVRIHDLKYAGVSACEKIAKVQAAVAVQNASGVVFSALDEVAWLLNIRGNDISFCPTVMSYAFVTQTNCHLFIHDFKLSEAVSEHLQHASVIIHGYDDILAFLQQYISECGENMGSILADVNQLSWGIWQCLGKHARLFTSPITLMKAIKNDAEIDGMANAHVRDGVALTAFLHWLEREVTARPNEMTEYEVSEVLAQFRAKMPGFVSLSFE